MDFQVVQLAYAKPGAEDIVFNPTVLALIAKWPANTKVFSICGPPDVGKSTLCMIMLRYFAEDWSGEQDSPTKNFFPEDFDKIKGFTLRQPGEFAMPGVWVLNKPINIPVKMGGGHFVIVDTAGLYCGSGKLGAMFAGVGCLLSSLFAFQVPGPLQAAHLDDFAQFAMCAGPAIKNALSTALPKQSSVDGFIPKLLIVSCQMSDDWIQDAGFETSTLWSLNAEDVRDRLNDMLRERLREQPKSKANASSIRSLFRDSEYAFTREATVEDLELLQDKCKVDRIQTKFGTSSSALVYRVLKATRPKMRMGYNKMSWDMMPKILDAFVRNMNDAPSVHEVLKKNKAQALFDDFTERLQCIDAELSMDEWYAQVVELGEDFTLAMQQHKVSSENQLEYRKRFQEEHIKPLHWKKETEAKNIEKLREQKARCETMEQESKRKESSKVAEMQRTFNTRVAEMQRAFDTRVAEMQRLYDAKMKLAQQNADVAKRNMEKMERAYNAQVAEMQRVIDCKDAEMLQLEEQFFEMQQVYGAELQQAKQDAQAEVAKIEAEYVTRRYQEMTDEEFLK